MGFGGPAGTRPGEAGGIGHAFPPAPGGPCVDGWIPVVLDGSPACPSSPWPSVAGFEAGLWHGHCVNVALSHPSLSRATLRKHFCLGWRLEERREAGALASCPCPRVCPPEEGQYLENSRSRVHTPSVLVTQGERAPTGFSAQRKSYTLPRTNSSPRPGCSLHKNQHPLWQEPSPTATGTATIQLWI